jgi:hypothetical protein
LVFPRLRKRKLSYVVAWRHFIAPSPRMWSWKQKKISLQFQFLSLSLRRSVSISEIHLSILKIQFEGKSEGEKNWPPVCVTLLYRMLWRHTLQLPFPPLTSLLFRVTGHHWIISQSGWPDEFVKM